MPGSATRRRPGAEGMRQHGDAVAGAGLGEDRLEMILDGVLGQRHLPCHRARIAAGGEQAEELLLSDGEATGAGEQLKALGCGCLLDRDDDGRSVAGSLPWRWPWSWRWRRSCFVESEPGRAQRQPEPVGKMYAS